MYDAIIKNGMIYDGTGNPWFRGDLGIQGGIITKLGRIKNQSALRIIDADGLVVSPGFIDIASNTEENVFNSHSRLSKLAQGVTTEIFGNSGMSWGPVTDDFFEEMKDYNKIVFSNMYLSRNWRDIGEFLKILEEIGLVTNVGTQVGYGSVRSAVMGLSRRKPDCAEIKKMKQLVSKAFDDGVFGMSCSFTIPPGLFSTNEELIDICEAIADKDGYFSCTIRFGGDNTLESIKELIAISTKTGVPMHISHFDITGRYSWGKSVEAINIIKEARKRGIDVTCDQYPYIASQLSLRLLLPPWTQEFFGLHLKEKLHNPDNKVLIKKQFAEGILNWDNPSKRAGWENIIISGSKNRLFEGKSIKEIAESMEICPEETLINLILDDEENATIVVFEKSESDIINILRQPYVMVATTSYSTTHPRCFGTYPRLLGKYVREQEVITLEEAVRKITSLPAQRLNIKDRGMLKEGMKADITIFDPNVINDMASYMIPNQPSEGIIYVVVNGEIVIDKGIYTGLTPGRVLRKNSLS